jgi:hypothetical protein
MPDINIGDHVSITITDDLSASGLLDIPKTSLLSQAGIKQMICRTAAFVAQMEQPVNQSGFTKATFGANFSSPSKLVGDGIKLSVKSDVTGEICLHTAAEKKLFDDDFSCEVAIADNQCWMALEIDASLTGKLSATIDGFGVGLQDNTSAIFTTYKLLEATSGEFPSLKDALVAVVQSYSVNYNVANVRAQAPGTINVSDLKGGVKFKGSYSLPIDVNSLASVNLPFNYKMEVNPGATLEVAGQFVVRSHRVSDTELRFGVYKKRGTTFKASLTASAGVEADVGGTDLLAKFFSAVFPGIDLDKVGITGKNAKALEDAIEDSVDHSLSLSLNASCSASNTDEAAVIYSINLGAGDQQQTDAAIASALHGDWTALATLSNATLLRNIFRETQKREHKIVINLLGIYNAETVDSFVKSCTILHDEDGQVVVTDKLTTSHIAVASMPFMADADKLRSALSQAFLATVAYSACGSGSPQIKDFSIHQTYYCFKDKMAQTEMWQQVALGKALQLITDGTWDTLLAAQSAFGHVKVSAQAEYDTAAAMKLFFKDPAQRTTRSLAELEQTGRRMMLAFTDPSAPNATALISVLKDDALWAAMDAQGAVSTFGTIDGLRRLNPNELAYVGSAWTDITWWADAMSKVAPKLVDVLNALQQSTAPDFSKDRKFMAARNALAGVLGQVTRNSRAAFAGGWGVAVMEQLSGFAAPTTLDIIADGGINQHYESPKPG